MQSWVNEIYNEDVILTSGELATLRHQNSEV